MRQSKAETTDIFRWYSAWRFFGIAKMFNASNVFIAAMAAAACTWYNLICKVSCCVLLCQEEE